MRAEFPNLPRQFAISLRVSTFIIKRGSVLFICQQKEQFLLKILLTAKLNGIVLQDRFFVIFMSFSRNKCYEIKDMSAFDKLPIPFFIFVSSLYTSLLRCCLCSSHAPALSPCLGVTYGCEVRMCLGLPSRQPLLVVVSSVKRWRGKSDGNVKVKNRIIVLFVDH
jgi:hypothetical protein